MYKARHDFFECTRRDTTSSTVSAKTIDDDSMIKRFDEMVAFATRFPVHESSSVSLVIQIMSDTSKLVAVFR